jgi:hypothetical protein
LRVYVSSRFGLENTAQSRISAISPFAPTDRVYQAMEIHDRLEAADNIQRRLFRLAGAGQRKA